MKRRQLISSLSLPFACGTLCALSLPVRAQGKYPDRPITYIVAYTPGSANDILVRIMAPELGTNLGGTIVVENRPGAGGTVGMAAVARSRPDGYTLGLGSTATMAVNRALYKKLPYDPLVDFQPVVPFASTPNVLVVPANSSVRSTQELITRMDGKKLNYSSPGNGTTQHLAGVLFTNVTGKQAEHVPYRGPAEAVQALVSGEVDYGFASLPSAIGQIRSGRLRLLGATPLKPPPSLPEARSLASQGLAGFDRTDVWFGLVVPTGTPEPVVRALEQASLKTLSNADVRSKLTAAGYDPAPPATPKEFSDFVKDQVAFWTELVKKSGATVD